MFNLLRTILFLIATLTYLQSNAQRIAPGLYVSEKGGILKKYAILNITNDSVTFESFTRWQGQWLPAIGPWDKNYSPQSLSINEDSRYSNENVVVFMDENEIKAEVENAFAGKKFIFKKVEELPEHYQNIKTVSAEFCNRKQ